ncbi:MAG: hypothetical protein Q9219_004735 [cf. Caloplaca sp. 3 TL-2023]
MSLHALRLSKLPTLLFIAGFWLSSLVQHSTQAVFVPHIYPAKLSTTPAPECFKLSLAPPLKQNQCNDELEWFLEESRKYDVLDLVGANTPYTFTQSGRAQERGKCYVTITSDDLFVTDQYTYGDLARFTQKILESCRDGRLMSGKGGTVKMTDGRDIWGGFYLRVDAWNPYP